MEGLIKSPTRGQKRGEGVACRALEKSVIEPLASHVGSKPTGRYSRPIVETCLREKRGR